MGCCVGARLVRKDWHNGHEEELKQRPGSKRGLRVSERQRERVGFRGSATSEAERRKV